MRLRQHARRRLSRALNQCGPGPLFLIDRLETRRLLSGETVTTIPPVLANTASAASNSITLDQYFSNSTLPGTLAIFNTSEGTIEVALSDQATPQTVANFLSYVNSGAYNNSIFHRSTDLTNNSPASPSDPGTIIQGGGYNISNNQLAAIPTNAPVADEYSSEIYKDVAGTLAMAKTSTANSATDEWYFNVTDNTELDTPTTDPNGVQTSYTVFGNVLSGTSVLSTIAALPTYNFGGGLTSVPVLGLTEAQIQAGASVGLNNLVYTTDITTEPGTSYTVSSDNKALVAPTITNGVLSFAYGAGLFGTANITITATNLDRTSATTILSVTVPNPATPGAGPVTAPFTAPYTITGTSSTFSVLGPDTDSVGALNPGTVTIQTPPAHGTATVNSSTGFITYTPNAGYIGPDTLTYTVADTFGTVSAPGVVTLDAVPTAVKLNVSAGRVLVFNEPDGIVGHLSVTGGSAVVTFTNFQVTTKSRGNIIVASGLGTNITDITVNNAQQFASLSVTSNGPISIGTVNDANTLTRLYAPSATLSGNMSIGAVVNLTAAAINGATLNLGALPGGNFTNLQIQNVTNSDVNAAGNLGLVKSRQWIISDGTKHYLDAEFINNLQVSGVFDDGLNLFYNRFGLANANVGNPTGPWNIAGELVKATLGTLGPSWSLTDESAIQNLTFSKGITGTSSQNIIISAAGISKLTVKGTTTDAVFEANGTFDSRYELIGKLTFGGAVTDSVIYSNGSIGSITAPSMAGTRVYAGVQISVAQNAALASGFSDVANNASIGSITLGRGTAAFSNSLISAAFVGVLNLGKTPSANGGNPLGVSAHFIERISATLVPGGVIKAGPAQLKSAAALTAYETKGKLALGDFEISLF